jgi:hypothetical protein
MERVKSYIIFILGYDLLNEDLRESEESECDLAFEKCEKLADEFLNSRFNLSTKSLYECIKDFLEEKIS